MLITTAIITATDTAPGLGERITLAAITVIIRAEIIKAAITKVVIAIEITTITARAADTPAEMSTSETARATAKTIGIGIVTL